VLQPSGVGQKKHEPFGGGPADLTTAPNYRKQSISYRADRCTKAVIISEGRARAIWEDVHISVTAILDRRRDREEVRFWWNSHYQAQHCKIWLQGAVNRSVNAANQNMVFVARAGIWYEVSGV
jgi:hypothetical protein